MALKALMLRNNIDKKQKELEALRAKDADFKTREEELEAAIAEAETEEQQAAVNEAIEAFDAEKKAHEDEMSKLSGEIDALENELKETERSKEVPKGDKPKEERKNVVMQTKINIRSLDRNTRAFDALPDAQRSAILEQEDVKGFLKELRSYKGQTRALTGGELTIPVVFLDLIAENMFRYSKLLDRVRVRNVSGQARQTIAGTIPEAVWTEMCGAINELNLVFNQVTLDGYKVAGYIPVCNSLLDDSDLDLAGYIVEMISEAIGLAMDKAILYGTGSNMPLGIVTRLAQTAQPEGYPASAPAWSDLHTTNIQTIAATLTGAEFWAALTVALGNAYSVYARGEKFWAMNSKTYALLRSKVITFTATGDIAANVFGFLPIITGDVDILEFIPDGDIIGGYGDLYLLAQRGGMEIEASREVQFIQDNTVFRGKMRADGLPVIPQAFVAVNINGAAVTTTATFAADTANDANLIGITVGSASLTPAFDPAVQSYAVTVTGTTGAVSATTAQAGANVAISYNGENVKNGGTITYATGANDLTFTVKNGNKTKVYTVTVTK